MKTQLLLIGKHPELLQIAMARPAGKILACGSEVNTLFQKQAKAS
jgi:hypothetical protein